MAERKACSIHKQHRPGIRRSDGSETTEVHHIWPTGEGGPDVPRNRVRVCPNGHSRIHELLNALLRGGGALPAGMAGRYHPREREIAMRGYRAVVEHRSMAGVPLDAPVRAAAPAAAPRKEQPVTAPFAASRRQRWLADAASRAWRTVFQFIAVDVMLTVIPLLNDAIDHGQRIEWGKLGLMAVRAFLGGVLAYVMRLKVPPKTEGPQPDVFEPPDAGA